MCNHTSIFPFVLLMLYVIIPEAIIIIVVVKWQFFRRYSVFNVASYLTLDIINTHFVQRCEIGHALGCCWLYFIVFNVHILSGDLLHLLHSVVRVHQFESRLHRGQFFLLIQRSLRLNQGLHFFVLVFIVFWCPLVTTVHPCSWVPFVKLKLVQHLLSQLCIKHNLIGRSRFNNNGSQSWIQWSQHATSKVKSIFFLSNADIGLVILECHHDISDHGILSGKLWKCLEIGPQTGCFRIIYVVWYWY